MASVYSGNVNRSDLMMHTAVAIPPDDGPTGVVFNGTNDFVLSDGKPAAFIFVSEGGTVSGWNTAAGTTALVAATVPNAIYKGVTIGNNGSQSLLYAANFHSGHIDVFDASFHPTTPSGSFSD